MPDLLQHLLQLKNSDEYPLHMPGHKRQFGEKLLGNPYEIDITEIEGYDNLYEADGILKEAMERAAKVCGAEETFFLVNGSTVGILSAVTAVTQPGDKIIVARNCHKAVFHAMELRQLKAVYLHPQYLMEWDMSGAVSVDEVRELLQQHPDARAVVITSPTYEGIVSPVAEIAAVVHEAGIPLIVDEAHGAHFPHDKRFPESAIQAGADVVIQSMHKTLPSFTQTALLHMKKGYADTACIKEYIGYYQTSSPSYLFMAGMDQCMALLEEKGSRLWDNFFEMQENLSKTLKELDYIRIFSENEPGKLVVSVKGTNMSGRQLQQILLEKYHIQVEMAAGSYVLGILTFCDTKEGFERLATALLEIDRGLKSSETVKNVYEEANITEDVVYSLSEVRRKEKEETLFSETEGRIVADYVNLYPPGIPLLIPGERIKREHITLIEGYLARNMHVQGMNNGNIWVCR